LAVRFDHRRGGVCVPEGVRLLTAPAINPAEVGNAETVVVLPFNEPNLQLLSW
jgi:hypothetical protein